MRFFPKKLLEPDLPLSQKIGLICIVAGEVFTVLLVIWLIFK